MNIKDIKHEISNRCFIAKNKDDQAGYIAMRDFAMKLLNQLDEPQKPVVPKFLDEYIKENEGKRAVDIFSSDWLYEEPSVLEEKVAKWLSDNETEENNRRYLIAVQAFVTGDYEVEKEPLYMVPLLTDKEGNKKILVERRGEYDIIWDYENEDDWHELLTEEQIKSVNPDYWKFAVLYEPSKEENNE